MSANSKTSFCCLGGQMSAVAGVQCRSELSASILQPPSLVKDLVCESVGDFSTRLKEVGW